MKQTQIFSQIILQTKKYLTNQNYSANVPTEGVVPPSANASKSIDVPKSILAPSASISISRIEFITEFTNFSFTFFFFSAKYVPAPINAITNTAAAPIYNPFCTVPSIALAFNPSPNAPSPCVIAELLP